MLEEVLANTKSNMDQTIEHLQHDLGGIRTGKANPALLDSIKVDYYGQKVPLKQVASIAVPDARLLTVQPWDKNVIGDIGTGERHLKTEQLVLPVFDIVQLAIQGRI